MSKCLCNRGQHHSTPFSFKSFVWAVNDEFIFVCVQKAIEGLKGNLISWTSFRLWCHHMAYLSKAKPSTYTWLLSVCFKNIPFPLLPFLAIIQPLKWPHFSVMYFLCAKNVAFEQEFLSFCSCNVMRSTTYLKEGRGAPYING